MKIKGKNNKKKETIKTKPLVPRPKYIQTTFSYFIMDTFSN